MRKIYKYEIDPQKVGEDNTILLNLPDGAILLSVGTQMNQGTAVPGSSPEKMYLWALVEPQRELKQRSLLIASTGHPQDELLLEVAEFIGSVCFKTAQLAFHIFDLGWKGSGIPTKVFGTDNIIEFPSQQMAAAKADEEGGNILH